MTISVVQRVTTAQFIKLFGHLQTVPMEKKKKKGHVDVCSFFKIIFYFFFTSTHVINLFSMADI